MKRKSGAPPIYSDSLKITIAREYLSGEQSYGQLAEKYSLNNAGVARSMVRWYARHYSQDRLPVVKKAPIDPNSNPANELLVEQKAGIGKEKDKQLEEALLKVEALELLIANAQKELGVDLIKKPGTKQPGK
ncbi:hypothetical protein [Chitinophaga sp.]|uniref:hypothetical protein n=1 Tax=Chitinophaga sp. TaxID=1869181 RepID=UPI002F91E169